METIFLNTENSKTNESNKSSYYFTDKFNLKNSNKNIALVNLAFITNGKNIKSAYNNNEFKISAPTSIPDKIFGTKRSNLVKVDRKRKVWYML